MSTEVQLAIYDLSRGMARSLSSQFLGPAHSIDIIPHTAILAFGREYYFGGGIQSADPGEFRRYSGIFPIEVQSLGRTSVTKEEFDAWCHSVTRDGTYAPESYDLLRRNCNNFANDAALRGLRLGRGVPDWILDVPDRFLSSPMGQMIRPILDGMQMSGPGATGGGHTFGGGGMARTAPQAPVAVAAAAANPWADMPAPTAPAPSPRPSPDTPVLDSFDRPLLSADSSAVDMCVARLCKSIPDEGERNALRSFGDQLKAPKESQLSHSILEPALPILFRCLDASSPAEATFALMLLRLVVLRNPADSGATLELKECVLLVGAKLLGGATGSVLGGRAARSMAWCVLSNAFATDITSSFLISNDKALRDNLIDAAMADISPDQQPQKEVRQSATAFVYNLVRCTASAGVERSEDEDALPDIYVTLLCGMMEGITEETDATVQLRRMLAMGKILCSGKGGTVHEGAKNLVTDLGFTDAICSLQISAGGDGHADSNKVKKLASELHRVLS
uniref:PPPDE domain-containing protein n=1 Tax=Trieres chinensis TaxID=1514140 RepID=A0A7S1ZAS5_TRICV|mmetsp:Transcript_21126/g.42592  ORF Transcript_21126/g.42592 Transcript_21126/m.42592 type:complete len:507 (+) Transcript_21126:154-1674(+)